MALQAFSRGLRGVISSNVNALAATRTVRPRFPPTAGQSAGDSDVRNDEPRGLVLGPSAPHATGTPVPALAAPLFDYFRQGCPRGGRHAHWERSSRVVPAPGQGEPEAGATTPPRSGRLFGHDHLCRLSPNPRGISGYILYCGCRDPAKAYSSRTPGTRWVPPHAAPAASLDLLQKNAGLHLYIHDNMTVMDAVKKVRAPANLKGGGTPPTPLRSPPSEKKHPDCLVRHFTAIKNKKIPQIVAVRNRFTPQMSRGPSSLLIPDAPLTPKICASGLPSRRNTDGVEISSYVTALLPFRVTWGA